MISKLLMRRKELQSLQVSQLATKSRHKVCHPKLNQVLASWVSWWEENGVTATSEAI
ncbi:hypothetical protein L914_16428 [Phytophthora nicotianae]|uniref:HTH CENPB-type domain-containing protein n=1 Tax=Phytophthora nicotianae TaxID=4792 RepID=W2I8H6_PHYNI|nr:hypothetical protein L916_16499 [Phytophthora nicotianae]ETM36985.1 hypothetical protein L914_16428 [Phytophthora nicotianae]